MGGVPGPSTATRVTKVSYWTQATAQDRRPEDGSRHNRSGALPDVFFWFLKHFFLDFHVSELVGVEYLTTVQTFDVFNVFFTRYHADLWVFAGGVHLGDLSVQPILLGKIVPAGFSLSNLFLCIPPRFTEFNQKSALLHDLQGSLKGCC